MKLIKYKFLSAEINHGTEEEPIIEQLIIDKEIKCHTKASFDANYSIVEKEAIKGTIEITGEFDPEIIETPTWQDKIEAQVAYNSMILGTLIEEA